MTHDDVAELLGAYALDAVEPEEAVLVAAHVRECPWCTAELAEHREVAGILGDVGGDAPKGLWESIAAQATRPAGAGRPGTEPWPEGLRPLRRDDRSRRAVRGPRLAAVAVLAAAAVVIALLAVQVGRLEDRVSNLTAVSGELGLSEAVQSALLTPGTRRVAMRSTGGHRATLAQLVLVPSGGAFLVDATLAALPSSRTYQLWSLTGGHPVSLGLLGARPSIVPFVAGPPTRSTVYAITVEPASGSMAPTTAPVAQSA